MAEKPIVDEKFRISLRQSWKKRLARFVQIRVKGAPFSPNTMLIRVMLSEALPGPPNIE